MICALRDEETSEARLIVLVSHYCYHFIMIIRIDNSINSNGIFIIGILSIIVIVMLLSLVLLFLLL